MALRYWADRWLDSFLNTLTLSQNCAAISSCRENCCIIFRSWKQCRWWTCCCSAKHRWIAATPVALRPCMRQQRMAMFQWCGSAVTSVKLVQRGYHGHHVIIACWLARCKSHNSSLGNGLHVFTGHTIQWGIYEFRRFCCVTGSFCWVRGLSWIAKGKALHLCTAQWEMGTKRHGLLPDLLLVLARKFRSATKGFEVSVVQKIGKISEMYFFVFFWWCRLPCSRVAQCWHISGSFPKCAFVFPEIQKQYYSRLALIPHLFEIGNHMPWSSVAMHSKIRSSDASRRNKPTPSCSNLMFTSHHLTLV